MRCQKMCNESRSFPKKFHNFLVKSSKLPVITHCNHILQEPEANNEVLVKEVPKWDQSQSETVANSFPRLELGWQINCLLVSLMWHLMTVILLFLVTLPTHAYLLRAQVIPKVASYRGPLSEVRVEENGEIRTLSCKRDCEWRRVKMIPLSVIRSIRYQISKVPLHTRHSKRWYSGAFCSSTPGYKIQFDADNGKRFLGRGDLCSGGGVENINSDGLIRFLQGLLDFEQAPLF